VSVGSETWARPGATAARRRPGVPARAPEAALAVLCAAALVATLHATRGLTFFFDEWEFILHRRGISLSTFLAPHNGQHPSVLPVAVYKVMLQVFGLGSYLPYRLMIAASHLGCAVLLYVYARPRVGAWWALLPTALLLFLGAAWQDILWPFQIGYLFSVASGLGMLLALDGRPRRGLLACILLTISLTSSAIGFGFLVAACVELALQPRRVASAWIVGVPLAILAVIFLGWGGSDSASQLAGPAVAVRYALDMAAAGAGGLAGTGLDWGRPLLAVGAVALTLLVLRRPPLGPRFTALAVGAVVLWILTGVSRAEFQPPVPADTSRYIYPSAVLLLLIAVTALAGLRGRPRPGAAVAAAAATALACIMGLGLLGDGGGGLRSLSQALLPELTALEAARGHVDPGFAVDPQRAPPVTARSYLEAVDAFGSPAPSVQAVRRGSAQEKAQFDGALARALGVVSSGPAGAPAGAPPQVELAAQGQVSTSGSCDVFRSSGSGAALDVALRAGQAVSVSPSAGPAVELRLRRLAPDFGSGAVAGTVPGGGSATLAVPRDTLPDAWHLRLSPRQQVRVCATSR
jgi:hypothetical protein